MIAASICFSAFAQDPEEDPTSTAPQEYTDLLDLLPDELRSRLPESFFSDTAEGIAAGVRDLSDFTALSRLLLETVGLKLNDCLPALGVILALLLLSSICGAFRSSIRSESVGKAFSFAVSLSALSVLLVQCYGTVRAVVGYFETLTRLTGGVLPLVGALWTVGGNVTAAAASSAGLSVYLTLLGEAVGNTVIPFCGVCLAAAAVGALDPELRLGALTASLKKHYTTFLAFLMTLLLAMLSFQTILAARADSLAMRGAKFAAGNLIPVVGGSVSELLRTVSAGVGYLRGAVGLSALLLVFLTLFPTIAELFLWHLTWQLAASAADLLGCSAEKKLLDEAASLCGYLLAAACICSSALFLALVLVVRSASAIG